MKVCIKAISLVLTLIMVFAVLSACTGNKSTDSSGESTTATTVSTTSGKTDKPVNDQDNLPEGLDFGGREIKIYTIAQSYGAGEISQERTGGGLVPDSVFERNVYVQVRLNCKIVSEEVVGDTNTPAMLTKVEAMVKVDGSSENEIFATASYRMYPLAVNGLLKDINELSYIDREKDYYSQGYNEAVSIGNAQYLITGKMSLTYYRYMMAVLFNRKLFEDNGVAYPYQTVRDGNWDIAEMAKISADIYDDTNGNGRVDIETDGGDTVGYMVFTGSGSSQTDGFIPGCGLRVTAKTEDNYYKVGINVDHYRGAMDALINLMHLTKGSYASRDLGNDAVQKYFANGKAGMITFRMYILETQDIIKLGATDTYGILPYPKYDKEVQEDYISYVQDQCFLFGFPVTLKGDDLTIIGQFFEAYSFESYRTVKKAYYEKALTVRYAKDLDSIEMLEIIDTNTYVDAANVFQFPVNTTQFRTMYATGENTVSSMLASTVTMGTLNTKLEEVNGIFRELHGNK